MGSALQHVGFSSCGPQALGYMSSGVGVHGLSCSMACGILVPRPGIKPTLEGGLLTIGPAGKYQEEGKNSDRSLQCSVTNSTKDSTFQISTTNGPRFSSYLNPSQWPLNSVYNVPHFEDKETETEKVAGFLSPQDWKRQKIRGGLKSMPVQASVPSQSDIFSVPDII